MNTEYTFSTPEHAYTINPSPDVPDLVRIEATFYEALEEVLNSLELAGVDEASSFASLMIEEDMDQSGTFYFIEISKASVCIWLNFEVLNYMGVSLA